MLHVAIEFEIGQTNFLEDSTDFLNPACITVPAGDAPIILEVKWDAYLPEIIRDAVSVPNRRVGAFSKYAQCRIYG